MNVTHNPIGSWKRNAWKLVLSKMPLTDQCGLFTFIRLSLCCGESSCPHLFGTLPDLMFVSLHCNCNGEINLSCVFFGLRTVSLSHLTFC